MLLETWNESWEENFLPRLRASEDAIHVPTIFHLNLLQLETFKNEGSYVGISERVAHIRIALDMEPFLHERVADRLEDYSDLANTTMELTRIAQEFAQFKSNLQGR